MKLVIILILTISATFTSGRIHRLKIENDDRRYIALSTFGFYKGGILEVKLLHFRPEPFRDTDTYGFTLDRTSSDDMYPYLEEHQENCLLSGNSSYNHYHNLSKTVSFIMDFKAKRLRVNCTSDLQMIHLYKNISEVPETDKSSSVSDSRLFVNRRKRTTNVKSNNFNMNCSQVFLPLIKEESNGRVYYSTSFVMFVASEKEEGLYNLYLHSCPNYNFDTPVSLNFIMEIKENNQGNYLSAGEMPLPALYFMMALLFFLSGCFWVFILSKSNHPVFKIHYLMALLVYLKSLSLLFHAINYHFIQTKGEHVAAWAILYYITHLLKGSVLFIVIVLVGTGWTFIKHILSEKDKKIFMIVLPLQILANVAEIIIEESEEGDIEHKTWKDIFIFVDLICCGAILVPVVWSIRHLEEASQTDGKAAINLRKLKLFRHFYIMVVCYIYFTRIIVYLLKMTVQFQYQWLDEMFREMSAYTFFVLTGYKFRPASANPYFQVSLDDDDEDDKNDIVITSTGLTEGLKKVNRIVTSVNDGNSEEKESLVLKMESSHEYD